MPDIAPALPALEELLGLLSGTQAESEVAAFIGELIRPITDADNSPRKGVEQSTLNPAALQDLFDSTLEGLDGLAKELDLTSSSLRGESNRIAARSRSGLDWHHKSLQQVYETIEDIEAHFRKVGLTAVRIGQSLSQTELQRQKAEHAEILLRYFLAFNTLSYERMLEDPESERLELLSNEILAPLAEEQNAGLAAEILSDVNIICEDLNAPHLDNAVRCLRVFHERAEQQLLSRFEAAAMIEGLDGQPDVAVMKECALHLLNFGDPIKLYNTFIYTIVAKQIEAVRGVEDLRDADEMRDALSTYFGIVSNVCQKAFTLIRQVFAASASLKVTRMLIDRMVSDPAFGIQVRVSTVLNVEIVQQSLSLSDALDMLLMIHDKTHALATDLIDNCSKAERAYLEDLQRGGDVSGSGLSRGQDKESLEDDIDQEEGPQVGNLNGQQAHESRSQKALSLYLKGLFAELFVGQRDSYFEKESALLRQRLIDVLTGVTAGIELTSLEGDTRKLGGEKQQSKVQSSVLLALRHEQIESYEMMLRNWLREGVLTALLDICREAISRNAKMFRNDSSKADNILEMLSALHQFLAAGILLPSLSAASNLVQQQTSGEPAQSFWKVLQSVHVWIDSYKSFFRRTALPEAESSATVRTQLLESLRRFLLKVERAGAKTVERGLEAILRTLERIHREGIKNSDYSPREHVAELQATRPCLLMRDLLTQQMELMHLTLPKPDVRVILRTLGLRTQRMLLSRIKQLRINTSGALVLMQDVETLHGCLTPADSPEVEDAFDELKEIVGLFIVPPQNLASLMQHGHLANLHQLDIHAFVSRRADYSVHGLRAGWARQLFGDDVLSDEGDVGSGSGR